MNEVHEIESGNLLRIIQECGIRQHNQALHITPSDVFRDEIFPSSLISTHKTPTITSQWRTQFTETFSGR